MKFIVKLFPEIIIKSDGVRKRFSKILASNLRTILTKQDETITVYKGWDYIEVNSKDHTKQKILIAALQKIPGIHHILLVEETTFTDLHDIYQQTLAKVADKLINKTFSVRVKRKGKHSFTSIDAERYIGGGLNQAVASAKVQLNKPEIEVQLAIQDNKIQIISQRYEGLGGYPLGTQDDVLSLISGGYDSGVASYMFIRRGCRTHYCFFNLGGDQHEIGVKQMAYHLWQNYSSSHKVKFVSVNFADVVGEILTKIDNSLMGVVLKRMMLLAASQVAEKIKVNAIVTGEATGQVSSQTLANLKVINMATDSLVLRPLITHDKETIIRLARQIGTEDIAKTMPEYCGVISNKPTVKADLNIVKQAEENFDFSILDKAITDAEIIDIREIETITNQELKVISSVDIAGSNDIIIDIRAPASQEKKPLLMPNNKVLIIPFFKLLKQFAELDQQFNYLLYCENGSMSKIQALYLKNAGYSNIKIFNYSNN